MVITPYDGLVSAGAETVLCKWTLKGEKRPTLLSRLQAAVTGVVLSDDGSLVALLMGILAIICIYTTYFQRIIVFTLLCSPLWPLAIRCRQSPTVLDVRSQFSPGKLF